MKNNIRTRTIKASCYHDENFFKKEVATIFNQEWQWVGRSEMLKKPGDFITTQIAHYPIILIKDKSNKTLGFHNVCRHRASKVILQSEGNCKKIICPYHGWNYNLDGRLSNPSNFFGSTDFNYKDHSLYPINIEEKYGLVFANLDPKSDALDKWLGIFSNTIDQHYRDDFIFHNELSFDVHANWKTYIDNYQEGYHIPSVHPQLNRDVVWEEYSINNSNNCSIHSVPERANSRQPGSFGWIFPNFIFNVYGRGIVFQRIEPIKPKWCRVVYNLLRPLDISTDDFESNEGKYQLEVSLEDQNLIPDIQQNLQTGIYKTGPLSMKYESSVAFFHDLLTKKMSKGV